MKAVVYRKPKRLVLEEIARPQVQADQVLVKVANTGFCGSDHSVVAHDFLPDGTTLGHEVSGTVAELGAAVTGLALGDRVTVRPSYCGRCQNCLAGHSALCTDGRRSIGLADMAGGYAEYMLVYPQMLIPIPAGVDSRNAAMTEMFATSLHAIYSSGRSAGAALVIGGGPIGLGLVRLLKLKGFSPIVLSEPKADKRHIADKFGADATVDPFNEDIETRSRELTGGRGFDVVFECSGVAGNVQKGINCLNNCGVLSLVSVIAGKVEINALSLNINRETRIVAVGPSSHGENREVLALMAAKKLDGSLLVSDLATLETLPGLYEERIDKGLTVKVVVQIGEEF